jgi:hypothetical protein
MPSLKTQPRKVSFEHEAQDKRVLTLSSRLLVDNAIARVTGLTVSQVRYRRKYANDKGIGVSKIAIRNGRGKIGSMLLAESFDSADIDKAVERNLRAANLI